MTDTDHDRLVAGLAALAVDPPAGLLDRIAAHWTRVPGPIGDLVVAFTDQGIVYVRMPSHEDFAVSFRQRFARPLLPADQPPPGLLAALQSGQMASLRFDLRGLTGFQRAVLEATRTIPRGELRTYSWVAREIGRPRAVRAVGSALGRNPVPVCIPCHRVTRNDGGLGGYVFGPAVKQALLRRESVELM